MYPRRYEDALGLRQGQIDEDGLYVNGGAYAVSHVLMRACRECLDEGKNPAEDSAVRLIVQNLFDLCKIETVNMNEIINENIQIENTIRRNVGNWSNRIALSNVEQDQWSPIIE